MLDAKAKTTANANIAIPVREWTRFQSFKIVLRKESYYVTQSAGGTVGDLALLDLVTTRYLRALRSLDGIIFQAVFSSDSLRKIKSGRKGTILDLALNLLGPEELAREVGEALANVSAYLQHPLFLEASVRYVNPHYYYPNNSMTDLRHMIGPRRDNPRSARVAQGIENVLESLGHAPRQGLPSERPAELALESYQPDTRLKRHGNSIYEQAILLTLMANHVSLQPPA